MKQKIRPLSKESSYRGLKVTNSSKSLTAMAAKWILKSFFIGRPLLSSFILHKMNGTYKQNNKKSLKGISFRNKGLVDFFDIELFGDINANLEVFTFVDQCKGIGKIIKLLDFDLVTDMNFMLF